jgi:hypothetical protein
VGKILQRELPGRSAHVGRPTPSRSYSIGLCIPYLHAIPYQTGKTDSAAKVEAKDRTDDSARRHVPCTDAAQAPTYMCEELLLLPRRTSNVPIVV